MYTFDVHLKTIKLKCTQSVYISRLFNWIDLFQVYIKMYSIDLHFKSILNVQRYHLSTFQAYTIGLYFKLVTLKNGYFSLTIKIASIFQK